MFEISLSGKAPIYEQIFNGISGLISSGRMSPGEKLPAVREVAKMLGINPNTVQKAYFLLEQAGLIYSVPAKGSYVCENETASAALRKKALDDLREQICAAAAAGVSESEAAALLHQIYSQDKRG
ncbi:MAG: GntR family transcriptional regulator [Oscillospiraceae bacterium]